MSSATLFLVLVFIISLGTLTNSADDVYGASFIFGDSLVDAGNNNYISTLSKADIKPNGIDFKASGGEPTGRYTNGRTIGDIIGTSRISPSPLHKIHVHHFGFIHCVLQGKNWANLTTHSRSWRQILLAGQS